MSVDSHIISPSVPSGVRIASNRNVEPSVRVICEVFKLIPAGLMTFFSTVTSQYAVSSPNEAVIVATPAATAVTFPFSSTVAIASSELLHLIVPSAPSGSTMASSLNESPSASDLLDSLKAIPDGLMALSVTVIVICVSITLKPGWGDWNEIVPSPVFLASNVAVSVPFSFIGENDTNCTISFSGTVTSKSGLNHEFSG